MSSKYSCLVSISLVTFFFALTAQIYSINHFKVTEQVGGSNFFEIEIFSDHKLYDLGYLLLKKQIRNLFSLRSYCKFSFLRDGLRDTPKVLSCQTPLDLLEILARESSFQQRVITTDPIRLLVSSICSTSSSRKKLNKKSSKWKLKQISTEWKAN